MIAGDPVAEVARLRAALAKVQQISGLMNSMRAVEIREIVREALAVRRTPPQGAPPSPTTGMVGEVNTKRSAELDLAVERWRARLPNGEGEL